MPDTGFDLRPEDLVAIRARFPAGDVLDLVDRDPIRERPEAKELQRAAWRVAADLLPQGWGVGEWWDEEGALTRDLQVVAPDDDVTAFVTLSCVGPFFTLWWAGRTSPPGEAWQQVEANLAEAFPRALSLRYLPVAHPRMDEEIPGLRLGSSEAPVTVRTALFYSAIWMG